MVFFSFNIFPATLICISGSRTLHLGISKALYHAAQAFLKQLILLYHSSLSPLLHETVQFFITSDSASIYLSIWEEIKFKEKQKMAQKDRAPCIDDTLL